MKSRKGIVLESMESDVITLEDGYQYFDTTKGWLSAADLRDIADELDRRNAEWDAEVRATLGDGQPTRKFTGTVAAGSGYDWDAATFEFEVPDDATDDDIRKAAYAAAWEECQVDYDEVKPRKKKVKTD